eukprot:Amastigsp_a525_59.p3 type:complete len:144 gc:universal Amastigsp_a525_59:226-657(+)
MSSPNMDASTATRVGSGSAASAGPAPAAPAAGSSISSTSSPSPSSPSSSPAPAMPPRKMALPLTRPSRASSAFLRALSSASRSSISRSNLAFHCKNSSRVTGVPRDASSAMRAASARRAASASISATRASNARSKVSLIVFTR